ncbi:PPK2 family polyphosphate kinase [Microbacterium sp. H1-D42]|uniref:PPK2 family polyphosphate kinase n=1 Tax=Microbacterium sp. H1-D42 TaxID=2925844 RepID=UPI001F53832A|nr:PPK2 family polyphosphate kinase [Microbacterium sp. H1-D42]UNK71595.1 polyphosphate kinase 2 family protein [Microbacterium sp. H1-D42]
MSKHRWKHEPTEILLVRDGFALAGVDAGGTPGFHGDQGHGEKELARQMSQLGDLQERLYAGRNERGDAVLLVLQAMDTAGKGGVVRHVVGGVDPQGVALAAFKQPTAEELEHDFLWRVEKRLPEAGFIGVFDRSHYEDVLIGKIHELADEAEIERRYEAIVEFERRIAASGTRIIKVMLHISKDEQKARLTERLDRADKHWKYNPSDVDERMRWDEYMAAYQTVFERTSTPEAPWYVVPANHKWYARLAVQRLLLDALKEIDPQWPAAEFDVDVEKKRLAAT